MRLVNAHFAIWSTFKRGVGMTFGPDGRTLYVITDMAGPVQAIKEGPITPTTALWSPGALIIFRYQR
jgi:hypothetical protein